MKKPLYFIVALGLFAPKSHGHCPTLQERELSKAEIADLVNNPDCKIRSVEDILARIQPSYFSGYSLVYQSHSLQGPYAIDFLNPRAIIYGSAASGPLGSLIMTFNGNPKFPGYNTLEMLEMRTRENRVENMFNFFEIEFPRANTSGKVRISENNPAKCVRCHDYPAKPIFSSYPFWAGVYGSMRFPTRAARNLESAKYSKFIDGAPSHSRYKFLMPFKPEQDCIGTDCWTDYYGALERSSSDLNVVLARTNVERSISLLMKSPEYNKTKFAFASALLECSAWPQALPDHVRMALEENMDRLFNLKQRITDRRADLLFRDAYNSSATIELSARYDGISYEKGLEKLAAFFGPYPDHKRLTVDTLFKQGPHQDALMPAALRLLMEGRGLRVGGWFLPLEHESYRIHDGGVVESDGWLKTLARRDPELAPYLPQIETLVQGRRENMTWDNSLCEEWFRLSQIRMADMQIAPLRPREKAQAGYPTAFFANCAECHSMGLDLRAPNIPFDNEFKMKQWLATSTNRHLIASRINGKGGRPMPPGRLLSPAERAEIFRYLKTSANN